MMTVLIMVGRAIRTERTRTTRLLRRGLQHAKWAEEQKNLLPAVDYVLLSYYEDDTKT